MPGLIHKNCQLILGRVIFKAPLGVWGLQTLIVYKVGNYVCYPKKRRLNQVF